MICIIYKICKKNVAESFKLRYDVSMIMFVTISVSVSEISNADKNSKVTGLFELQETKKRRVESARKVSVDGKLPPNEGNISRGVASHPLPFEEPFLHVA